jgi:adenylylsulfate kinase
MPPPFAVWVTGLPASGKSTLTAALVKELRKRGIDPAVLESDAFRKVLGPSLTHDAPDRDRFYEALVYVGGLLFDRGVPVLFDATANRRAYRQRARDRFPRFVEVFVDCPIDVCMERDPKGIYRRAKEGTARAVPGLQAPYEPPERPDVHVRGDREDPESAARRVLDVLIESGFVPAPCGRRA